MPAAGFKPATPASDRPQTLVLDPSATGMEFDPRTIEVSRPTYGERYGYDGILDKNRTLKEPNLKSLI
jgi:hypothetical protein